MSALDGDHERSHRPTLDMAADRGDEIARAVDGARKDVIDRLTEAAVRDHRRFDPDQLRQKHDPSLSAESCAQLAALTRLHPKNRTRLSDPRRLPGGL